MNNQIRTCTLWIAFVLITALVATANLALAAPPPEMSQQSANLIRRLQINVMAGRIVAESPPSRLQPNPAQGTKETLRIQDDEGDTLLRYEKDDINDHLLIDMGHGSSLLITRTPGPEPAFKPLRFEQFDIGLTTDYQPRAPNPAGPPRGVRLTVGEGDEQVVVEAAGIWQLLVVEPELCREHLNPVLELLHTNWRLEQLANSAQEQLVLLVQAGDLDVTDYWDDLIKRLGDNAYAVRHRADRLLRQAGVDVLPYLHTVDVAQLDPEQRMRIREITNSLSSDIEADTPRLAAWQLVGDVSVWLALMSSDVASTRSLALEQLAAILGRPLEFDPAADSGVRQKQLAALHDELEQMGLLTVRRVAPADE